MISQQKLLHHYKVIKKNNKLNNIDDASNLIRVLSELYENMEIVHTNEYKIFLKELLAPLGKILTEIPCQFIDGDLQKIRNLTLEIFHRIPLNEVKKIFFFFFF